MTTMKMAMTALAVVFLAGALPALAQPGGIGRREGVDRPSRGEGQGRPQADGGQRGGEDRGGENRGGGERWGGGGPRSRDTASVPDAPRAPQAAQAAQAPEPRAQGQAMPDRGRDRMAPDARRAARTDDGFRGGDRRQPDRREWDRSSQPGADTPRTAGGRADGDRRGGDRGDWRGRGDGDGRGGDRGDRRDGDRGDRRDGDRGDWRGRGGDRGGYDNDRRGDHRRWERGRYPSVYFSSHRYRHSWRPPYGYYVHAWNFGDFLPRSWYGAEYFIADPWNFDLPLAPPGYDWVRVGDDALLIDSFNGRVVQVVRDVFW